MTDNRTTELLPCPFCGGEAEILTAESMHGGYLFGIMCNDCRSRGDVYDTEAEAIAAWNARAERTCEFKPFDWYGTIHEKIVRCRDCKWLYEYMGSSYCDCNYMEHTVKPDDFCSWGEGKEA